MELAKLKAWQTTQERRYRLVTEQDTATRLVQIRRIVADVFTLEEMNDLAFQLGINYEEIKGDSPLEKARELVLYCENRGLVENLIHTCQAQRPHAPWPIL